MRRWLTLLTLLVLVVPEAHAALDGRRLRFAVRIRCGRGARERLLEVEPSPR